MTSVEALPTTVDEPTGVEPDVVEVDPDAPEPASKPPGPRVDRGRVAAIVVFAIVVFIAIFLVFEGPIASIMYGARQHQLTVNLAKPMVKVGRGDAVGVIQIPKIGVNAVIIE